MRLHVRALEGGSSQGIWVTTAATASTPLKLVQRIRPKVIHTKGIRPKGIRPKGIRPKGIDGGRLGSDLMPQLDGGGAVALLRVSLLRVSLLRRLQREGVRSADPIVGGEDLAR